MRQGPTRCLRSRCHNRIGRIAAAHLYSRQHHTFSWRRVILRVQVSYQCRLVARLRCRTHADEHNRIRAHWPYGFLGRSRQQKSWHTCIHTDRHGRGAGHDTKLWSSRLPGVAQHQAAAVRAHDWVRLSFVYPYAQLTFKAPSLSTLLVFCSKLPITPR